MKYIDAEKLKAEIEKRVRICREISEREQDENPDMGNYYRGKAVSLEEILLHIDSLQQEPKEIGEAIDVAIEVLPKEEAEDASLDEAAEEYAYNNWEDNDYHTGASEGLPFDAIGHTERCFIAGAEWMAKQLLKGSPLPEDTVLFRKGVEEGRRLERDDLALTWEDIRRIIKKADDLLDDPKARVAFQNHNEEYYYERVLDEYNKLHQATKE